MNGFKKLWQKSKSVPTDLTVRTRYFGSKGGCLQGAVFCPDDPDRTFEVDLLGPQNDDTVIASASATRQDIHGDPVPPGHGFSIALPPHWNDGEKRLVRLRVRGTDKIFPSSQKFYQNLATSGQLYLAELDGLRADLSTTVEKGLIRGHVIVVTHSLERTGAPLIALNIARYFSQQLLQRVTCISLGPEDSLAADFRSVCNRVVIQPGKKSALTTDFFAEIETTLGDLPPNSPTLVVVNSICSHPVADLFGRLGFPVCWLFHEFPHMFSLPDIERALNCADELILPNELIRSSHLDYVQDSNMRKMLEQADIVGQGILSETDDPSLPENSAEIRTEQRRSWGVDDDDFVVMSVGTTDPRKGLDWFILLARMYRSRNPEAKVKFVWLGRHTANQFTRHMLLDIETMGLGDMVLLVGETTDTEPAYLASDALLMCSRLDPFPTVVMEALKYHKPVIGFDHGQGTSEILAAAECGIEIPYFDLDAAIEAIERYRGDRELARNHGEAGFNFVTKRFTHEALGRAIIRASVRATGVEHPMTQALNGQRLRTRSLLPRRIEDDDDGQLLLVRGNMKSGTNWICNVLNHHPEICIRGEYHWSEENWPVHPEFEPLQEGVSEPKFAIQARESMRLNKLPGVRYYGDRTPMSLTDELFPEARVVYIHRDPRDLLVSNAFHHLNNTQAATAYCESSGDQSWRDLVDQHAKEPSLLKQHPDLLLANETFVQHAVQMVVNSLLADIRALEGELSVGDRVRIVRYETLHQNFDAEVETLYRWLGLDPDRVKSFHRNTRPGFDGHENSSGFYRKGQPGDWRNYLHREEASYLWEHLQDAFRWGQYEQDASWIDNLPSRTSATSAQT